MTTSTDQYEAPAEAEREMGALRRRRTAVMLARMLSYVAYAWVTVSLIILTFGFFLLLFNANPDAGFAEWVYRHLDRTMEPFRGIFPAARTAAGATLDVAILFAMLVYGLVALGVRSLIDWLTYRLDRLERRIRSDQLPGQRSQAAPAHASHRAQQ